jgi:hypothetical protein
VNPAFFPTVDTWQVPRKALVASLREMARDGICGNEGIALWLGTRDSGIVTITHVVCLRGDDVARDPDYLNVGSATLNEVGDVAIGHGVTFVGQIHSHGPQFGVDLSPTDRRFGVAVPYFLSLVAPDYALRTGISLEDCGVHVFEPSNGFRRLTRDEITERLALVEDAEITEIVVNSARS